ncbi:MAG: CaiB/BaiF CoA transferase family protein [Acetivibrionales bacterium]|jgi:CoA:oxalate CoA-transferase
MTNGALSNVTVLDLTRVLAGPYCSMLLADMGANVIKIELPGKGDDSRGHYPQKDGESYYFMNLNRNKRSMTLNLKSAEGKKIFLELVTKADIVLENYRPGVMERLGLGYEELKKANPTIIYGCVSGFGHTGPYSDRPGYDIIGQAMSGIMSTTGWPDGDPTRTGTAISDVMGGISLCTGVLAAYINRLQTGIGQKVDIALVDSMVSSLEIINQIYLATGEIPGRIGNRYEASYPYDSFKAKDGMLVIGAGNNKLYAILTEVMGRKDLLEDPRYTTNILRVRNYKTLKVEIEKWLEDLTVTEAVDMLLKAGCPAAPIYNIAQVVNDPHISGAREMFVEIDHPVVGKMKITGNQIKLSRTPVKYSRPAPLLGQHTKEIMTEYLNIPESQVDRMAAEGVF